MYEQHIVHRPKPGLNGLTLLVSAYILYQTNRARLVEQKMLRFLALYGLTKHIWDRSTLRGHLETWIPTARVQVVRYGGKVTLRVGQGVQKEYERLREFDVVDGVTL